MDNRLKDSFRDIIKLADKLFSRVDSVPIHPLPVNLGLLRLYAIHTKLAAIPDAVNDFPHSQKEIKEEEANLSEELVANALHYFIYANDAYSANPRIIQQDILLNNLPDTDTNIKVPRHIVFLDHIAKSIVVSVRGTASISDMLTDLYIEPYQFLDASKNLFAHHGMAESAEALLPLVTNAINEIRKQTPGTNPGDKKSSWWNKIGHRGKNKYRDYEVVVTGHSLGAGTASLLAIMLCMKSNISATAYAFAPPPVISTTEMISHQRNWKSRLQLPFGKQSREPYYHIHSFVHNNDIISRSSHTQILSLISALSAVDKVKWGALERGAILLRNVLSAEEASVIYEALKTRKHVVEGNDRDLYIPGDIYIMRPVADCVETGETNERNSSSVDNPNGRAEIFTINGTVTPQAVSTQSDPSFVAVNITATGTATTTTAGEEGNTNTTKQEVAFNLFGVNIRPPPTPAQIGAAAGLIVTEVQTMAAQGANQTISAVGNFTRDILPQDFNNATSAAAAASASDYAEYYCVKKVTDRRALFNGLMYYGDAMVYDHLTVPFEKAILRLRN